MAIKLGIIVTTGDPRTAADLASRAETHGWDGVFTWDAISIGTIDTYDPWSCVSIEWITEEFKV